MKYFVPVEENIDSSNIAEDVDENGNLYIVYDVTKGYNKDTIVKYDKIIYKAFKTIYPLVNYVWKDLIAGSEYTTNMHTQTDILQDTSNQILIDVVENETTVFIESNQTYYIAKSTGQVDFMNEDISNPANFNVIANPLYRNDYFYPDGFQNTIYWNYYKVSNKHRAFDKAVGSQSEKDDEITYSFIQNSISSIIFLNVDADTVEITITDLLTGDVFPTQTTIMTDTSHLNTYEKVCTQQPRQKTTTTFQFSSRFSMQIDVKITKTGSRAKVGVIKMGLLEDIGITIDGVDVKNKSYNESGIRDNGEYVWNPTDKESNKVSQIGYEIQYDTSLYDGIDSKLKEITDKDIVLLGDDRDEEAFVTLQNYCVVTSASTTVYSNKTVSDGSISVETFA